MNKQLILCNLAWLTATLLIIAYSGTAKGNEQAHNLNFSPPAPCTEDYVNFLNPRFFLDGIDRYKQLQWTASNAKLKASVPVNDQFQDARSCWYSLSRLKSLICLTERNASKYNLTGELGIRFYYATYPDTAQQEVLLPGITKQVNIPVGWHHTLFMVPTHYNEQLKLDEDIYLVRTTRFNADSRKEVIQESNTGFVTKPDWKKLQSAKPGQPNYMIMVLGQAVVNQSSAQNQGMLCPPTCPPGTN